MKQYSTKLFLILIFFLSLTSSFGQKIGDTKIIKEFRFKSCHCDPACIFSFTDESNNKYVAYSFPDGGAKANAKTKKILDKIVSSCNDENECIYLGQVFYATLRYDYFLNVFENIESPKKDKGWCLINLEKFIPQTIIIEGVISALYDYQGTSGGSSAKFKIMDPINKKTYSAECGFLHYEPNFIRADKIDGRTKITWPNGEIDQKYGGLTKGMNVKIEGKTMPDGTILVLKIKVKEKANKTANSSAVSKIIGEIKSIDNSGNHLWYVELLGESSIANIGLVSPTSLQHKRPIIPHRYMIKMEELNIGLTYK